MKCIQEDVSGRCAWAPDLLTGTFPVPAALLSLVMPEDNLIERAKQGDISAFESLYREHVGRVFALCLRMVANPSRAEDLTQEAFVRAWEKLSTFRGTSAFPTWLHRLTVNLILSDMRSRKRRRDEGISTHELYAVPDPRPVRKPETTLDLERAIAGLPEQARMVFLLHDVQGFRHQEIADLMGIAVGTSKAHLHRARRILREDLTS